MPDTTELLSRAAALRPLLEQNADATDALRRLPDTSVAALREAGLCRLMVPKRFGGFETSIHTYIEVMAELGRGCGSTSWVASLVNVCAWLAGLFPDRAQQDVWASNPDAWVAGSLAPHGDAKPVDGGWRVSGRWMWASGCLHAQWAACGIHMSDDKGETVNFGLSLMPMTDLTIEDTWHMAGMKGTGSNTIVARDVFVPEHRFLPYPAAFAGTYRTEHTDETVYRVALVPVTILILVGSQLGHGQGRARPRGVEGAGAGHHAHEHGEAERIRGVSDSSGRCGDEDRDGDPACLARRRRPGWVRGRSEHPDLVARARVRADTALVAKYCREAVEILVSAHGTSSMADSNRLQRLWRDIHVASRHAITEWQVNLEVYGKALLGVEPNITALI